MPPDGALLSKGNSPCAAPSEGEIYMTEIEHPTDNTENQMKAVPLAESEGNPAPLGDTVAAPDISSVVKSASEPAIVPSTEPPQILGAIQSLAGDLAALRQEFESKIKYDASKERMVDTLHKELQTYREDLHFKILRPVFADLISMHDDMGNLLRPDDAEKSTSESEKNLRRSLSTFRDTIEEILERNGVTIFTEDGQVFVPQRQRAIKTVDTMDPEKDSQVAERIRKGFRYEGRIIRPEIVHTFKFKANVQINESATKKEA
jgi:molecular chaperone GrpE